MIDLYTIQQALDGAGASSNTSNLSIDVEFSDVGFDSLDMFNLFVELERITDHQIPDNEIDKLTTPQAVINYYASIKQSM